MANNFHLISKDGVVEMVPFTAEEEIEKAKKDLAYEWELLRKTRNEMLVASDLLVLPDRWASYTPQKQKAFSDYRQALRDLPQNTLDPFSVVWPTKPE